MNERGPFPLRLASGNWRWNDWLSAGGQNPYGNVWLVNRGDCCRGQRQKYGYQRRSSTKRNIIRDLRFVPEGVSIPGIDFSDLPGVATRCDY